MKQDDLHIKTSQVAILWVKTHNRRNTFTRMSLDPRTTALMRQRKYRCTAEDTKQIAALMMEVNVVFDST